MSLTLSSMAGEDKSKNKIKIWLEEEGFLVSEKSEEASDFHLVISNLYGQGTFADIVKMKSKNMIIVGSALQNPPEFLRLFATIDEQERSDFFGQIQRELLKFQVEHELHPNRLMPERMIIRDTVYDEDLSRINFMDCLKRVKFASLFLLWSIGHKFSPDASKNFTLHHSVTEGGSQPPYR
jgi:hypothetical protein